MSNEPDIEFKVYNKLTRAGDIYETRQVRENFAFFYQKFFMNSKTNFKTQKKWTLNLFLCCLVVATGSIQFGYNIASMNSVTPVYIYIFFFVMLLRKFEFKF